MDEAEGRQLAAIRKTGEPRKSWAQDRANTLTNSFGVLDEDGRAIKGLQVEFAVYVSPVLGLKKFVFTLMRVDKGLQERAYQLEVNPRKGLRPGDHQYSHEHYGQRTRIEADPSWAQAEFDAAVQLFCARCNLTLSEPLPHYEEMRLR